MRDTRPALDVSELPDVVFGPRDIMWWGTIGFMVIEGFTLVLCAAALLYLRQNFASWPPEGTARPALGVPIAQVVVMLVGLVPVWRLRATARAFDLRRTRALLLAVTLFCTTSVGLRVWELVQSLGVRWDANAYGSAQWLVVGSHATLLFIELVELVGMTAMFYIAPIEEKHFSDAADVVYYWLFIVLTWLPLHVLCFWLPRWA